MERLEGNEDVFSRVLGDPDLRRAAEQYLSGEVYRRILARVEALDKTNPVEP